MSKIDIDRFICDLIEYGCSPYGEKDYLLALQQQALDFQDGKLVEIEEISGKEENVSPNPEFKIEKGKFYMCIKDYHKDNNPSINELSFKKGRVYYSFSDSSIKTEQGYGELFNPQILVEHFRPATEKDLTAYYPRYRKGDVLTDGKKYMKVLLWDYNEHNLAYYHFDYGIGKGSWLAYEADQKLSLTSMLDLPQTIKFNESEEIDSVWPKEVVDELLEETQKNTPKVKDELKKFFSNVFPTIYDIDIEKMVEEYKEEESKVLLPLGFSKEAINDFSLAYKNGIEDILKLIKEGGE